MTLEAPATKPLATKPLDSATNPLALAPDPPAKAPRAAPDDATYGWEMFVAFIFAVLSITVAVCVLALVGSWWMLGVALAVDLGITATMMRLVLGAFGAEEHRYPDMHTAEAASRAAISARAPALPTARPRLAAGH
ncbi:MAG: hypothetical protein KGL15_02625 [Acidobacteriota bacterium]|nr:hypothetical protein [Acidobacteriota bacterium]